VQYCLEEQVHVRYISPVSKRRHYLACLKITYVASDLWTEFCDLNAWLVSGRYTFGTFFCGRRQVWGDLVISPNLCTHRVVASRRSLHILSFWFTHHHLRQKWWFMYPRGSHSEPWTCHLQTRTRLLSPSNTLSSNLTLTELRSEPLIIIQQFCDRRTYSS
jgi:hypothetical protein